jgi:hypothetical protein
MGNGPRVFTCISLGWDVKIWRMDPGFSSIYLLGLKYGGARDTLSSLYIVGVKYGEHTLDFPLYISVWVKYGGRWTDPGFSFI